MIVRMEHLCEIHEVERDPVRFQRFGSLDEHIGKIRKMSDDPVLLGQREGREIGIGHVDIDIAFSGNAEDAGHPWA